MIAHVFAVVLGEHDKALPYSETAVDLAPSNHRYRYRRIKSLVSLKRYDEALALMNKTFDRGPDGKDIFALFDYEVNGSIPRLRLEAYLGKKMYAEAFREIDSFIAAEPANAAYYLSMISPQQIAEFRDVKLLDSLADSVGKAVSAWNESCQLYVGRAYLYSALGRPEKAKAEVAKALELVEKKQDAENAGPHNSLAWLLATCPDAKVRDAAKAVTLAKKAVELEPHSKYAWNTLGVAYYRAGDWKPAVKTLEKSMGMRNGEDRFFLAMAHWQLGDEEQARKWYDQAVAWMDKHQPDDEELRRFRAEAAALLGIRADPPPPTATKEGPPNKP
jgi:tetratricopeptide (TPR) repeat protein